MSNLAANIEFFQLQQNKWQKINLDSMRCDDNPRTHLKSCGWREFVITRLYWRNKVGQLPPHFIQMNWIKWGGSSSFLGVSGNSPPTLFKSFEVQMWPPWFGPIRQVVWGPIWIKWGGSCSKWPPTIGLKWVSAFEYFDLNIPTRTHPLYSSI